MEKQEIAFTLKQLYFPRFDCHFLRRPQSDDYNQAIRVEISILDDTHLQILLGISLQSLDLIVEKGAIGAIAEVAAIVEVKPVDKIEILSDVPHLPQILAQLVPFLREKINYYFSNNGIVVFLPPINTVELIKDPDLQTKTAIVDRRVTPPEKTK